jgi:hypothetical protein
VSPDRGPVAAIAHLRLSQMKDLLAEYAARHPGEFAAAITRMDDPDTRLLTSVLGRQGSAR